MDQEILSIYIEKATALRRVARINYSDSIEVLEQARFSIRQNIDRLEELLNGAVRFKSEAERSLAFMQSAHDLAWDRAVREDKPKLSFGSDMIAPRERYASASLKTIKEKTDLDDAQETFSYAKEAVEVIRNMYKGLDGYRLEVLSIIKNRSTPTSAEHLLPS